VPNLVPIWSIILILQAVKQSGPVFGLPCTVNSNAFDAVHATKVKSLLCLLCCCVEYLAAFRFILPLNIFIFNISLLRAHKLVVCITANKWPLNLQAPNQNWTDYASVIKQAKMFVQCRHEICGPPSGCTYCTALYTAPF